VNIAESYVKLVLAVGQHDDDYVDAFYGPDEWKTEANSAVVPLPEIERRAQELVAEVGDPSTLDTRRKAYLLGQLRALAARVQMLGGTRFSFDEEARALYDVTPPVNTEQHFQDIVSRLDGALPGRGPVPERYISYRNQFVMPPARIDAVFQVAIAAGRERTARHIPLPPNESFVVEYVTGKPWSDTTGTRDTTGASSRSTRACRSTSIAPWTSRVWHRAGVAGRGAQRVRA